MKLRAQTASIHARLDDRIALIDIESRLGLATFLNMHALAIGALCEADKQDWTEWSGALREMRALVSRDLVSTGAGLDTCHPQFSALPSGALGPAYVVTGSRLGARIMRQRLSSKDLLGSLEYFEVQSMDALWADILKTLEKLNDQAFESVQSDAMDTFALFESALNVSEQNTILR